MRKFFVICNEDCCTCLRHTERNDKKFSFSNCIQSFTKDSIYEVYVFNDCYIFESGYSMRKRHFTPLEKHIQNKIEEVLS